MNNLPALPNGISLATIKTHQLQELDGVPLVAVDTTKPGWQRAVANALNNFDDRLADHVNMEIDIQGVIVRWVSEPGQNGELREFIGTTLILADGSALHTGSGPVFRCLRDIAALYGLPPWSPPIKAMVIGKKSRNNPGSMLLLEVLSDGPAATQDPFK